MAGAKTAEELVAWQRSENLRIFIVAIIRRPPASLDRDFCWQIKRASSSVTDNISEGFGRYYPKEFHRYVLIARGELNETRNQLNRGFRDGLISQQQYEEGVELWEHAIKTTAGLQRYLASCIPKKPGRRPRRRRRT